MWLLHSYEMLCHLPLCSGKQHLSKVAHLYDQLVRGVYKQWTGLLEWWNSGMVDCIFSFMIFHFRCISSIPCGVYTHTI